MDLRIIVETTFEDGETKQRDIGRIRRSRDAMGLGNLGLGLDDAKTLLRRLQEAILSDQIHEVLAAGRKCGNCGKSRSIHDDRGRILDTPFGRFRVKAPRLRQCVCKAAGMREWAGSKR